MVDFSTTSCSDRRTEVPDGHTRSLSESTHGGTWHALLLPVCPDSQLYCCVVDRWLRFSKEVAQSSGFKLRVVLAGLTSIAHVFWDCTLEISGVLFLTARQPLLDLKSGSQLFHRVLPAYGSDPLIWSSTGNSQDFTPGSPKSLDGVTKTSWRNSFQSFERSLAR